MWFYITFFLPTFEWVIKCKYCGNNAITITTKSNLSINRIYCCIGLFSSSPAENGFVRRNRSEKRGVISMPHSGNTTILTDKILSNCNWFNFSLVIRVVFRVHSPHPPLYVSKLVSLVSFHSPLVLCSFYLLAIWCVGINCSFLDLLGYDCDKYAYMLGLILSNPHATTHLR